MATLNPQKIARQTASLQNSILAEIAAAMFDKNIMAISLYNLSHQFSAAYAIVDDGTEDGGLIGARILGVFLSTDTEGKPHLMILHDMEGCNLNTSTLMGDFDLFPIGETYAVIFNDDNILQSSLCALDETWSPLDTTIELYNTISEVLSMVDSPISKVTKLQRKNN